MRWLLILGCERGVVKAVWCTDYRQANSPAPKKSVFRSEGAVLLRVDVTHPVFVARALGHVTHLPPHLFRQGTSRPRV